MTDTLQYTHEGRIAVLEQVVSTLESGHAIIFPSDTVYALLAAADSAAAYGEIYAIKRRDPGKPLALLAAPSHPVVREIMKQLEDFEEEQDAFLCGELTTVFPKGRLKCIPPAVLSLQAGSIGIRLPAWEPLSDLIEQCGGLLWGTSANIAGAEPEVSEAGIFATLLEYDPAPALCVTIASELPGRVSDVVRFGSAGPELIR